MIFTHMIAADDSHFKLATEWEILVRYDQTFTFESTYIVEYSESSYLPFSTILQCILFSNPIYISFNQCSS